MDTNITFDPDDFRPKYYQLAEALKRQITEGILPVSTQIMPEEELAKALQVSRPTIRGAYKKLETEGYLFRIKGKGTFIAQPIFRKRQVVAVCEPNEKYNKNLAAVLSGIVRRAQESEVSVLVYSQDELLKKIADMRNNAEYMFAAIFLNVYEIRPDLLEALEKLNIPYIFEFNTLPLAKRYNYVDVDNESAMRKVVDHLFGLGHRNFALLSVNRSIPNHYIEREEATISRIRELSGVIHDDNIFRIDQADIAGGTERICAQILKEDDFPSAFICTSDYIAARTIMFLEKNDIAIPERVAVTGFDDNAEFNLLMNTKITTIRLNYFEVGIAAAGALLKLMDSFRNSKIQLKLDLDLIVRGSTVKGQN